MGRLVRHLTGIGGLTRLLIVFTCLFAGLAIAMSQRIQASQTQVIAISGYNMEFAYTRTQVEIIKLQAALLQSRLGDGGEDEARLQLAILAGRLTTVPSSVGGIVFPEAEKAKRDLSESLKATARFLADPLSEAEALAASERLSADARAFTGLGALANTRQAGLVERAQERLQHDIAMLNLLLVHLVFVGLVLVALVIAERARFARAAETDSLTGLGNRLHLKNPAYLPAASASTAVAVIDVDRFKQVNDRWGHATGDDLLRLIADVLRREASGCDLTLRLGGDEFLIVAFGPEARARLDAGCAGIERGFLLETRRHGFSGVGLSIGIAEGAWDGPQGIDALIGRADMAMYGEKNRRCVEASASGEMRADAVMPSYRAPAPARGRLLSLLRAIVSRSSAADAPRRSARSHGSSVAPGAMSPGATETDLTIA
ncbi:GGDEF domain-containing protein [Fulvimarina endophytica]|uniref:diguanylate cyclase n=1 Tax=Fulvimarina endophytica TaxID=2293836 RepID=A0A371X543_9HYPH|nr:GGDEF domain-containing protein [Fulvimarina endophytica]RFC64340.1 GGDEF domain-containing protein [Fulvimarina endophytica]